MSLPGLVIMGALAHPRVSVVTAAYEDLRFLDAAVESISRQTFQDLELVLVNDGAAQGDIFTRQSARDPRVRVLTNVVNLGPMEAANRGIRDARGDIIVRLDADDISRPDRVAHLVAALDADREIAVVGASFVNIDEDSRQGSITRMPETDLDIRWTLLFGNPFCHSTVAFRRRCFEAAGGYDPGWQASGDHEFWFRLLNHGRAANLQEILLDYRINPRGVSATHAKHRRERTDPLRQKSWSRLGVPYEPLIAAELYRFVSGFDMPDLSLRDSAYRVCLRLLRTFIGSSRPFSRASDRLNERRLVRTIVERMLADEMTYLPSAVNGDDLAWSQSFIAAPEYTTTSAQQRIEVLAAPEALLSSDAGAEAANGVTQRSGGNSVPEESRAQEASFFELGFLGPITLFTDAQCALILRHLRLGAHAPPRDWAKGRAASDRFFYDLATSPALLGHLRSLLGENILLWGTSIIERDPGRIHTWHTDIESCGGGGRFVSVWIGLENTSRDSALQLVSRSHAIGKTIQQVVSEHGMRRGEASNETIVGWAQTYDPLATLVQPDARDGQAILFDGRLWHASNNTRREGRRVALLLQYAAAETPIFVPDFSQLEWPFRYTDRRPPCIVVSGNDTGAVSRLVPAPAAGGSRERIPVQLHSFPLPFSADPGKKWRSHRFFRGTTSVVEVMNCHMTVLSPGQSPHPPHAHIEEEILIVLDGEADIVLSENIADIGARVERIRAGSLVFHPAYQHHTIRNCHTAPVTYLMFKWVAAPLKQEQPLDTKTFDFRAMLTEDKTKAFDLRRAFEHPTAYLGKLHAHVSIVQPGAGYPPHADDYDVAILLLQGKVETIDQIVEPLGVIFYPAGEMHGIKNIGHLPARYIVFEFHAPASCRVDELSRDNRLVTI